MLKSCTHSTACFVGQVASAYRHMCATVATDLDLRPEWIFTYTTVNIPVLPMSPSSEAAERATDPQLLVRRLRPAVFSPRLRTATISVACVDPEPACARRRSVSVVWSPPTSTAASHPRPVGDRESGGRNGSGPIVLGRAYVPATVPVRLAPGGGNVLVRLDLTHPDVQHALGEANAPPLDLEVIIATALPGGGGATSKATSGGEAAAADPVLLSSCSTGHPSSTKVSVPIVADGTVGSECGGAVGEQTVARPRSGRGGGRGSPRKNVLMVMVDDLAPLGRVFGGSAPADAVAILPNIERLARTGTSFVRQHVDIPVCIPSRVSMLTGTRAQTSRQTFEQHHFRDTPQITTMLETFQRGGYETYAYGKIFHFTTEEAGMHWRHAADFDTPDELYTDPRNNNRKGKDRPVYEFADDAPDQLYPDARIRQLTIEAIEDQQAAGNVAEKPFWIGCGFSKPHTPYVAPRRYWDLYDGVKIPLPEMRFPAGAPKIAHNQWNDFSQFNVTSTHASDAPEKMAVSDQDATQYIRAYMAAASFVDEQIGLVVDALGCLAPTTVTVLWSDHGYHLGTQGLWSKNSLFDASTRSVLMISDPASANRGARVDQIVESVDIFPTLLDLCQLQHPPLLEGTSLVPLLGGYGQRSGPLNTTTAGVSAADGGSGVPWKKDAAFSFVFKGGLDSSQGGWSIRTQRHRYTEWLETTPVTHPEGTNWSRQAEPVDEFFQSLSIVSVEAQLRSSDEGREPRVTGIELYDYEGDGERTNIGKISLKPGGGHRANLKKSRCPDEHRQLCEALARRLRQGWAELK